MEGRSRKKKEKRKRVWILLGVLAAAAGMSAVFFAMGDKMGETAGVSVPADPFVTERGQGTGLSEEGADQPGKGTGWSEGERPAGGEKENKIVIRTGDGRIDAASERTEPGQEELPSAEDSSQRETITLAFAGDVLLSDHVLDAYQKGGGIKGVVGESLLEAADEADLFMVNQEFPFSSRGTAAPDKQFTFRLPPEKVSLLKEMGVDLVTLANNHALDFGTEALLDTCSTLDGAGIPYVGAGEDLERAKVLYSTELGRWTVGFLGATRVIPVADWAATAYTPGMLSTYDPAILLEAIRKAKETCDLVVVYVHWGIEREGYPEDYQRQLGRQFLDAGADMVIGSHPHVLQGIEYYNGKPIVYSLGNFVFGSSIPRTVLLQAEWDGEEIRLRVLPATSSAGYTREIADKAEAQALFQYLGSISAGIEIDGEGRIYQK